MYTLHASAINASLTGASSIGLCTKTAAPQTLPAVSFNSNELSVSVGKATNVTFVSDGSGSYTLDNAMATGSGAGGGGNSGCAFQQCAEQQSHYERNNAPTKELHKL